MNTEEIDNILRNHPCYKGTFSLNNHPTIQNYPSCFVVNTQTSNLSGQHWFAIWVSNNRNGEVFDSYGVIPPTRTQLWMNTHCNIWTFNKTLYQNLFSDLCGAYCIYFIVNRLYKNSMKDVLKPLDNAKNPDEVVKNFLKTYKQ